MRSRGGNAVLATVAAIAVAGGGAAGVIAKPRIPSTVTLRAVDEGKDFFFRGRVRSDDARCERRRRVQITAGNGFASKPIVEGVVRTDENGRYELQVKTAENSIGNYRATALRRSRRSYVCRAARSEIVNPSAGTRVSPAARG